MLYLLASILALGVIAALTELLTPNKEEEEETAPECDDTNNESSNCDTCDLTCSLRALKSASKKLKNSSAILLVVLTLSACSNQKNTSQTRWWQAFNTRYNVYYNGSVAYINGSIEKENGNKDNFTEQIPLYTIGNKQSKAIGKSNYDRAIEKCEKAIQLHSIKKRPEWTKSRKKTAKDREWLSRKEYNPFMWKVWMLMGRSQFYQADFDNAISTFAYMSRLYETQPAIYCKAQAWLAKCYIESDWLYDAEDIIRKMQRDSIHWRAQKEWDYTYADYYIHSGEYAKAVPYLRKVISHEMRHKQKAREWFLMGQLQAALGNNREAYKAYKHVVRLNPPYEIEFNARIAMTEVLSGKQWRQMVSRLKRMAASDKNKEYLDQVYYAIGNIYMAHKDTLSAIAAYEKGNTKATRSGIEKGVLLLKLGNLYWDREKFSDAKRCYGEAIGLLDKERKDYEQLSRRSKVLDELVPHTEAIHLQDSLQELAHMSEKDRNAAIDRVIEALKKKEKEEKKAQAEANAAQHQNNGTGRAVTTNRTSTLNNTTSNGLWYFYNQMAVNQGKTTFQRLWGKRPNEDDWQRSNKTVVATFVNAQQDTLAQDSTMQDSLAADTTQAANDSVETDPHKRGYYMAQIPFTQEQIDASNKIIMDGLFNSGIIFKDKLDNLRLAEKAMLRLTNDYADYEKLDEAYYHLYLLYSRQGLPATADGYVEKLKTDFPESQWTTLLTDPYFKENALFGAHIEDSIYGATYEAFKANRFNEVEGNVKISEKRFPMGANRDRFLFIDGLTKLNTGNVQGCLTDMRLVVEKYPKSSVGEMAGMIINGVSQGRKLHGGQFTLGNIWAKRTDVMADSDSVSVRQFSPETNTPFVFIIAFNPDSVNQNKLLYEMARYNFTNFLVRNFDMAVESLDQYAQITIKGFQNYDEALQYAHQLYAQTAVTDLLNPSARALVISTQNLELLGKSLSYDDYKIFYQKHFLPLPVQKKALLIEPSEIIVEKEKAPTEQPLTQPTATDDGMYIMPQAGKDVKKAEPTGTTIIIPSAREQTRKKLEETYDSGTTVIKDNTKAKAESKPKQQPTDVDLGDEYYDLEGF